MTDISHTMCQAVSGSGLRCALLEDHARPSPDYPHISIEGCQFEEQVKPAIEEPTEFGSIVRAGYDEHTDRVLWVRTPGGWHAETRHGYHAYFIGLHDPEVLRVGIGENQDEAEGEAFTAGVRNTIARGIKVLEGFRDQAITAERKDAYQNAINVLRELS